MVMSRSSCLDQGAFAEMHRLHGTGDTRTHLDTLDRFKTAGELIPQRDIALLNDRDGHRQSRRLCRGLVRLTVFVGE